MLTTMNKMKCLLLIGLLGVASAVKRHYFPGIKPRAVDNCELCNKKVRRGNRHTCRCCGVVTCKKCSISDMQLSQVFDNEAKQYFPIIVQAIKNPGSVFNRLTGFSIWWCKNCVKLQREMLEETGRKICNVYCLCDLCGDRRKAMYYKSYPKMVEVFHKFPIAAKEAEAKRKQQEAERRKNEAKRKQQEAKKAKEKQKAERLFMKRTKEAKNKAKEKKEAERLFKEQMGSLQNPLYEGNPYYAYEMGEGNQQITDNDL